MSNPNTNPYTITPPPKEPALNLLVRYINIMTSPDTPNLTAGYIRNFNPVTDGPLDIYPENGPGLRVDKTNYNCWRSHMVHLVAFRRQRQTGNGMKIAELIAKCNAWLKEMKLGEKFNHAAVEQLMAGLVRDGLVVLQGELVVSRQGARARSLDQRAVAARGN